MTHAQVTAKKSGILLTRHSVYRVGQKLPTNLLAILLPNLNRYSHFFYGKIP